MVSLDCLVLTPSCELPSASGTPPEDPEGGAGGPACLLRRLREVAPEVQSVSSVEKREDCSATSSGINLSLRVLVDRISTPTIKDNYQRFQLLGASWLQQRGVQVNLYKEFKEKKLLGSTFSSVFK